MAGANLAQHPQETEADPAGHTALYQEEMIRIAILLLLFSPAAQTPGIEWRLVPTGFKKMEWTDAEIVTGYRWELQP